MPPTFGHVPGNPPGTPYASRQALSVALVHRPLQAGIWGTGDVGAQSIVVSGGYPDDEDYGDVIVYSRPGWPRSGVAATSSASGVHPRQRRPYSLRERTPCPCCQRCRRGHGVLTPPTAIGTTGFSGSTSIGRRGAGMGTSSVDTGFWRSRMTEPQQRPKPSRGQPRVRRLRSRGSSETLRPPGESRTATTMRARSAESLSRHRAAFPMRKARTSDHWSTPQWA